MNTHPTSAAPLWTLFNSPELRRVFREAGRDNGPALVEPQRPRPPLTGGAEAERPRNRILVHA